MTDLSVRPHGLLHGLSGPPWPGHVATAADTTARSGGPDGVIADVLSELARDPRLVHVRHLASRPARTARLRRPLAGAAASMLPDGGLWTHQAEAIDLVRSGRSIAVASGTGSGKSLCYQLPIAEACLDGGASLLVYPTKALAQDQLSSFASMDTPGMVAATYDGDCTAEERTWVRSNADVLLTNPEMLHHGILSNHTRWARFLHSLRYVVIDELHVMRGVFGTHVGQILRRLRRLVRHYGGDEPAFVFTSATIGEPQVLASELCGLDVTAVTDDGAPHAARSVALWHPGSSGNGSHQRSRWSVNAEAANVASTLISTGLRTLVFCRSRRGTELVAEDIRRSVGPTVAPTIRSYRSGYLSEERREIEHELFSGRLRGIVATTALELGVDIGGLDAVVLCGFPGTISSFWQQVGRAGRSTDSSLAVLVAGQDQLDQWMVRHPDELFTRSPERAVVNLDNPHVFVPHLGCAADELALDHGDHRYWPDQLDEGVRQLVMGDRASIRRRRGRRVAVWSGRGTPAPTIGLRSASSGEYAIVGPDDRVIGTVDDARVDSVLHVGAVYLHQGRSWLVTELDPQHRRARVEATSGETYTQARTATSIELLSVDRSRTVGGARLHLGSVEVTSQVTGYATRAVGSNELLERVALDLAPRSLVTRGVWYTFGESLLARAGLAHSDARREDLPGALHAAEHAAIGILPLFTICDRWDVGGVSSEWLRETGTATIVIHDAHPGGAGIAELAFDAADRHLCATAAVITDCPCDAGCPSCVQSPKCGNNNEPLHKASAARLLDAALIEPVPPVD